MLFRLAPQTIWTGRVTSSSSYPTLCQHLAFSTPLQQHLSALTFTGVSDPIAIGGTDFLQDVHVALAAAAAAVGGGGGGGGNGHIQYSSYITVSYYNSQSPPPGSSINFGGSAANMPE